MNSLVHFYSLALPLGVRYELTPWLSVHGGLNLSVFISVMHQVGDNWYRANEAYHPLDLGSELSLWWREGKRWGAFVKYEHGWVPQTRIRRVAADGTLLAPVRDIRHYALQFGLHLRLGPL